MAQHDGVPTLQVDDAGPGIPPAERERVFDRFYRRGLADEPGTGLGLAIVRSVAQRHGASLRWTIRRWAACASRCASPAQRHAPEVQRLLARSALRAALDCSLGKTGVGVADSGQPNFLFPPSATPTPALLAAAVTGQAVKTHAVTDRGV